jgi:hypothetical protein
VISPILANVYLHYAYDLWVHQWRRINATGDVIVVRYADDTIIGFEHEHEARTFLQDLQERMHTFDLALHADKTRLIRFGRHAVKQRAELGEGKPVDFLGFTHFCTRSRKRGSFVIGRKTIKKRMRAKLQAIKMELRKKMHDPIAKTGAWMKQMLQGHLNYFAVSGNDPSLWWFFNEVRKRWLRSQAAKPEGISHLGEVHPARRPLLPANSYCTRYPVTASTPEPEGRARCVTSARRDPRGGRGGSLVPTATMSATRVARLSEPVESKSCVNSIYTTHGRAQSKRANSLKANLSTNSHESCVR